MKPKQLPRLWCAMQGLLPLESCLAAQRAELAWPPEADHARADPQRRSAREKTRNRVAADGATVNLRPRGTVRAQS